MDEKQSISVTVGQADADIVGSDHRALQAAVDYVASLGGGSVRVGRGDYAMRDSLHLRSNVVIEGDGAILSKSDAASSNLVLDGDYGEEQITLANADGFRVGDGVSVATTLPEDSTTSWPRSSGEMAIGSESASR